MVVIVGWQFLFPPPEPPGAAGGRRAEAAGRDPATRRTAPAPSTDGDRGGPAGRGRSAASGDEAERWTGEDGESAAEAPAEPVASGAGGAGRPDGETSGPSCRTGAPSSCRWSFPQYEGPDGTGGPGPGPPGRSYPFGLVDATARAGRGRRAVRRRAVRPRRGPAVLPLLRPRGPGDEALRGRPNGLLGVDIEADGVGPGASPWARACATRRRATRSGSSSTGAPSTWAATTWRPWRSEKVARSGGERAPASPGSASRTPTSSPPWSRRRRSTGR